MDNNLAIIPARGGSKRIPDKNIKPFLGKPIIKYSIDAALKSNLFKEIIISTDDSRIAEIGIKVGGKVPFMRSPQNSDDNAILNNVIVEVVNNYKKKGFVWDYICVLLPTAPFISVDNLKKGLNLLVDNNFDSVRPIVKFSYPIQRAFQLKDHSVEMLNPENSIK